MHTSLLYFSTKVLAHPIEKDLVISNIMRTVRRRFNLHRNQEYVCSPSVEVAVHKTRLNVKRPKKPGKGELGEKVKLPRCGRKQGKVENVKMLQDLLEMANNNIDLANESAPRKAEEAHESYVMAHSSLKDAVSHSKKLLMSSVSIFDEKFVVQDVSTESREGGRKFVALLFEHLKVDNLILIEYIQLAGISFGCCVYEQETSVLLI